MNQPIPKFKAGDSVRRISRTADIGVVLGEPRFIAGRYRYKVNFGGEISNLMEADLESCVLTDEPREMILDGSFGDAESCLLYLTWLRVSGGLSNYMYSFYNSRTEFYPHQFKPLVKFLDGSGRVLLADEVGLGKTIEAGFVLLELIARRELNRALIVCPAKLRNKWRREMLDRFDLDFTLLNTSGLTSLIREYKARLKLDFKGIVSFETIRSERATESIRESDLDVDILIADEAHVLRNSSTQTHETASHLAERANKVLLLSATPINNSSKDLFNLLRLLDPDTYSDEGFFQTLRDVNAGVVEVERLIRRASPGVLAEISEKLSKLESSELGSLFQGNIFFERAKRMAAQPAQLDWIELQRCASKFNLLSSNIVRTRRIDAEKKRPLREPWTVRQDPHPLEKELYEKTFKLMMRYYENFRLPVMNVERILASCMPAFIQHYKSLLGAEDFRDLSWDDDDEEDTGENTEFGQNFLPQLAPILGECGEAILQQNIDTKLAELLEAIQTLEREDAPDCKIIIFSFFRRTIEYLSRELDKRGLKNVFIHGGVPSNPEDPGRDERELRRQRFEFEPDVRILLSSEVGSEGLDFQYAHIVVNYDLPWNPMRVEQRIGRVDRIGQQSEKILVYSLLLKGTVDDVIYQKLLGKIGVFRDSLGDMEGILGEDVESVVQAVFNPKLTPEQRDAQIEQQAKVLQNRMAEARELEKDAAKIIGTDQYIKDEISRIQSSRRYVGPEEIQRLVHRTLEGPPFHLNIDEPEPGLYASRFNSHTRHFFETRMDRNRAANMFRLALDRKPLQWTFDYGLATARQKVELLNLKHPAVRAICDDLEQKNAEGLKPTFKVAIPEQKDVSKGTYVLLVYFVRYEGVYDHKELITVAWDCQGEQHLDDTLAGSMLAQIIQDASDEEGDLIEPAELEQIVGALEEAAANRFENRRAEMEAEDRALVEQRRKAIVARARREVENQKARRQTMQEKIALGEATGGSVQNLRNLLRGVEMMIDRAEDRRDEQLEKLPAEVRVSLDWNLKSAGIVQVG